MSKIIRFILEVEVPDDTPLYDGHVDAILSELEDRLNREGYSMYDTSWEEGEV